MNSTLELSELNTMIGSLFTVGIASTEPDRNALALIRDHKVGGIILFARNIENPLQVASLCSRLQEEAIAATGVPLFLAVDQEGGRVARLKEPFTLQPGASEIGQSREPLQQAARFASVTAAEMSLVGLNMDMAPVLDVPSGEPERHLAGRTFGTNPENVAALGVKVIQELQRRKIFAVAKHFPGLGKAGLDPHHLLPIIDSPAAEMEERDLVPFRAAIKAGVCGIMTSHAVYPGLDPGTPATLSRKIITDLLRKKLGFRGLVITDDLEMGAVAGGPGVARSAVAAFQAGGDILLVCENHERIVESIDAVKRAVLRGDIPALRLRESAERIHRAKAAIPKDPDAISLEKVKAYFHWN
ncbi:MAG TPA: beta-N-acetylhexosaminidase [Desulfobacteraceae bacterium]|nr:beta-N-acetylhexosaminidase [Desulfobacteraceae bacterium]